MKENLKTINELHENLKKLQPFKQEDKARLDKKFRLEFNYNSNHMEGNTLTYGETELLLIFGETKGNHTIREYQETQAHDVAIKLIEQLAIDNERPLSEQVIKELNKIILVEPFWKEALTPDGQNTRRLINIGTYKAYPNSVRLQNGEIFEYASVTDTPILMQELMDWYRENETKLHPVELATLFHYKFVRIHPFDDGNGRISRLLMNYVLLKSGFPPVIIKSADKSNYLRALHNADVGDFEPLFDYISKEAIWSLKTAIKAGKGEDLEENDDFIKEIELIRRNLSTKDKSKSSLTVYESLVQIDNKLWKRLLNSLSQLNELYTNFQYSFFCNNTLIKSGISSFYVSDHFNFERIVISDNVIGMRASDLSGKEIMINNIGWRYELLGLKGSNPLVDSTILLETYFEDYKYLIQLKVDNSSIYETEKSYNDILLDTEIEEINKTLKKHLLDYIKQYIN